MQSIWSSLLVFILILAAIPFSAWVLRRSQTVRTGSGGSLGVVGAIAVGARERIAIVRADNKWLVVGVTAHSITLLSELDHAPETSNTGPGAPWAVPGERRFSDLLRGLKGNESR